MKALTSALLNQFSWLEHGFGTRQNPLSQNGMASLKQIHSNRVISVTSPGMAGEADALVTNQPDLAVSIRTADCLPILLADPRHYAVAAIHAGWRGTVADIACGTIRRMAADYETQPRDLYAAIGPGIGVCCYKVGPDVATQFGYEDQGTVHLNLAEENRRRLIAAGVANERIEILPMCTFCGTEEFHSYRREGERAGRMITFIRRKT